MIFLKTLIVIFFFIELTLFFLVKFFKRDFKWIIEEEDYQPFFSNELIKKYNNEIFDKNLGWDNKKIKKEEYLISVQKKFIYNFDKSGSRLTKNKFKKNISAIFGDSYSLSRYANQNESIQFFLEKYNKSKILNYGAGNYGLDQVLIKIKTKKLKGIENVIIIVVPETIVRIQSYWKHFLEFGNILGFKPKFIFKNNKLILQRGHVKLLDKKKY